MFFLCCLDRSIFARVRTCLSRQNFSHTEDFLITVLLPKTLSQGHSLAESVKFANAAAAIAVTRIGAQSAIPYKREVNL